LVYSEGNDQTSVTVIGLIAISGTGPKPQADMEGGGWSKWTFVLLDFCITVEFSVMTEKSGDFF
jgi:hypothetical protein